MHETLNQKIEYFKTKQLELVQLANETAEKTLPLKQQVTELERPLIVKGQEYRAEMKAAFGLADGENANVLELIEAIAKVRTWA
jgi:hypothetical protein